MNTATRDIFKHTNWQRELEIARDHADSYDPAEVNSQLVRVNPHFYLALVTLAARQHESSLATLKAEGEVVQLLKDMLSERGAGIPTAWRDAIRPILWRLLGQTQSTAPASPARIQAVIDAAQQWWCDRTANDWDSADLAKALVRLNGDWPGCPECDHNCGEPCMPATMDEQILGVDRHIAQLVHEGKLATPEGYQPPHGWTPDVRRVHMRAPAPHAAPAVPAADRTKELFWRERALKAEMALGTPPAPPLPAGEALRQAESLVQTSAEINQEAAKFAGTYVRAAFRVNSAEYRLIIESAAALVRLAAPLPAVERRDIDLPERVIDTVAQATGLCGPFTPTFYKFAQELKTEILARLPAVEPAAAGKVDTPVAYFINAHEGRLRPPLWTEVQAGSHADFTQFELRATPPSPQAGHAPEGGKP